MMAIYFNAWEDDFCDDPLLAIIGQLDSHFKEGVFRTIADRIRETALPLLWRNALGVLNKTTGLTLETDQTGQMNLIAEYLKQRETKDELKDALEQMSTKVVEETGHPLVFIIDELDRCRPTFAIELLERVKHIFDIPNMVFVFGVNRDELCSSLQSIYGAIDADVYLRRFFDMEFTLPEVDSEKFGRHLMQRLGLGEFFGELSKNASNGVHSEEFGVLVNYFPGLWGRLSLSLRDIDYCVRLIALVGRNLELRHYMYPWLLGLLITLKLKNSDLYRIFTQGRCRGSEVMDYIDVLPPPQALDRNSAHALLVIEAYLYRAELGHGDFESNTPSALSQLNLLKNGETPTNPEYLSKRTRMGSAQSAKRLIEIIQSERTGRFPDNAVSYLAKLIDLHQEIVRR